MQSPRAGLRPKSPITPLVANELFAADDRSAQLVVRPDGDVGAAKVRHGERIVERELTHGVAVVTVDALEPDAPFSIDVLGPGDRVIDTVTGQTRPPIDATYRFATISDVHLGAKGFGPLARQKDTGTPPYPVRCLRAAIDEAIAWGAEALVIKGDLTDHGHLHEWEQAAAALADHPIPLLLTAGNHDVWTTREVEAPAAIRELGLSYEPVQHLEAGGVRLVLADTSLPNKGWGKLSPVADAIAEAIDVDGPVWLGIHHNIQRTPVTWFWPPGISSLDANPVLERLAAVKPRAFISSGHTHRNRLHDVNGFTYTEVSSTSDFPGVWAGYEVGATTMRQTARRIAAPEALSWTERTRAAFGTFWPRWSQGRLDDRCVDSSL